MRNSGGSWRLFTGAACAIILLLIITMLPIYFIISTINRADDVNISGLQRFTTKKILHEIGKYSTGVSPKLQDGEIENMLTYLGNTQLYLDQEYSLDTFPEIAKLHTQYKRFVNRHNTIIVPLPPNATELEIAKDRLEQLNQWMILNRDYDLVISVQCDLVVMKCDHNTKKLANDNRRLSVICCQVYGALALIGILLIGILAWVKYDNCRQKDSLFEQEDRLARYREIGSSIPRCVMARLCQEIETTTRETVQMFKLVSHDVQERYPGDNRLNALTTTSAGCVGHVQRCARNLLLHNDIANHTYTPSCDRFDVSHLLCDLVSLYDNVCSQVNDTCYCTGDADALYYILSGAVENAVTHGGGSVQIIRSGNAIQVVNNPGRNHQKLLDVQQYQTLGSITATRKLRDSASGQAGSTYRGLYDIEIISAGSGYNPTLVAYPDKVVFSVEIHCDQDKGRALETKRYPLE